MLAVFVLFTTYLIINYFRGKQGKRIPIGYFSSGRLRITGSEILFKADRFVPPMLKFRNLMLELEVKLSLSEIERVERIAPHEVFKGFSKFFGNRWIRIFTKEDILEGDFLLVVGGTGFGIRGQRRKTEEIYSSLNALLSKDSNYDESKYRND